MASEMYVQILFFREESTKIYVNTARWIQLRCPRNHENREDLAILLFTLDKTTKKNALKSQITNLKHLLNKSNFMLAFNI